MPTITIFCDAKRMANPDLDIRYLLSDFIASRVPGLVDDGYDYGDDPDILEVYMTSDHPVDVDHVIEVAKAHKRWGNDIGTAILIILDE